VALGMGGSALRSMAYGKPLVVQGERGFWKLLEPSSLAGFERTGWFGIGDDQDGTAALERILRPLLADAGLRSELGAYARQIVVSGYGLDTATDRVEELYRAAIRSNQVKAHSKALLLPPYFAVLGYDLSRKIRRRLGGVPSDDFNTISRMQPTLRGNTS
jgi:hypothetical protein